MGLLGLLLAVALLAVATLLLVGLARREGYGARREGYGARREGYGARREGYDPPPLTPAPALFDGTFAPLRRVGPPPAYADALSPEVLPAQPCRGAVLPLGALPTRAGACVDAEGRLVAGSF